MQSLPKRYYMRVGILILIAVTVGGCAKFKLSRRLMSTPIGIVAGLSHPGGEFSEACQCAKHEVPVYIVSGRNTEENKKGPDPFGNKRSRKPTLGVAYVTIGEGLSPEELLQQTITPAKRKQARVAFSRIELFAQSESEELFHEHEALVQHEHNPWIQAVSRQLDRNQHRNVTVFVHGYNTELIENTLVAAEIYHYLGLQGAMISFEWPSESKILGYVQDKGNANFSTRHFRSLIANIARECHADSVTIIAHSAGAPIVVNALRELRLLDNGLTAEQVRQKYQVSRIVLAAPDMDLMAFINATRDRFQEVAGSVAVYASPKDRALGLSEKLYGNLRLGRAVGNLEEWERAILSNVRGLEMIDATVAEENFRNFLGHSYFHRDPWVSSDIGAFILGSSPSNRNLVRQQGDLFWQFPPDYPEQLRQRAERLKANPVKVNFSSPLESPTRH